MLMFAQQFSGINAAMFYSAKIFEQAGLKDNGNLKNLFIINKNLNLEPIYATIAMGGINVLQTLISVWLVDHPKCGRRSLLLIGLIGMCLSSIFISVSLSLAVIFI